jgi:hypothetical protein
MRPNTILMNFRLPITLKDDFEQICQTNNISMTTQLNLIIRSFVDEHTSVNDQPRSHDTETVTRKVQVIRKDWSHHR